MHWIAPSEKDTANATLEKRLWDTADQFRANSGLKPQAATRPNRSSPRFSIPLPLRERVGVRGAVRYRDVPGLCKAATLKEIEAQGWSLNPGRYVGVAPGEAVSDENFKEQLAALIEELETLNVAARELETTIASNVTEILEA